MQNVCFLMTRLKYCMGMLTLRSKLPLCASRRLDVQEQLGVTREIWDFDTNQPAQLQKIARGLKFRIWKTFIRQRNKDADQPVGLAHLLCPYVSRINLQKGYFLMTRLSLRCSDTVCGLVLKLRWLSMNSLTKSFNQQT